MNETIYSDSAGLALKPSEFRKITQLAQERAGLNLRSGKEALVAARLGKKLRQRGIQSFAEYYQQVLADETGQELVELIDALATNHTSFLRERAHFDFLVQAVGAEFRNERVLEIWSAACSTGEEPYSIVMCLADAFARAGASARGMRVLATDISTRVLTIAQRGIFGAERFRELPDPWRKTYLLRGRGKSEGFFKVKQEIARQVEFARMNLVEPFQFERQFHVIFCRNVMMYFDKPTQQDIVQRLGRRLAPGGYLFVGHSESLTGVQHGLEYVCPAVYRKSRPAALRMWP